MQCLYPITDLLTQNCWRLKVGLGSGSSPSEILPRALGEEIGHSEEAPAAVPERGQDLSQGDEFEINVFLKIKVTEFGDLQTPS